MSDADSTGRSELGPADGARDYLSVLFVLAAVLAVVLATVLLPVVSSLGLSQSPAASLVPVPGVNGTGEGSGSGGSGAPGQGSGGLGSGGGSQFGALNAGQRQSVGGSLADNGTNPLRSQSAEVHFTVRSSQPSYWRTGAYDVYTGSGWERSGPSDARAPLSGSSVRYEVTLEQAARSPPTVWRPESLSGESELRLTDGRTATAGEPLPAGTRYVGRSRAPPRNASVLRASDRDYPASVADRYTALPEETRAALEPFTDNVTAGADSPYGTAVRIERWLETEKGYSLNVSQPPDGDVATQFVFEMERGYCEYFATSMVAMLRSQGIPARYVVGYSTGQEVGPDTYRVRAMNAHAWVEVYFADVGWVRFDPTPGGPRLQQERESFQRQASGEYSPREEGSPGEVATPNSSDLPGSGEGTPTPSPDATSDGTNDTSDSIVRDPGTSDETTPEGSGGYAVSLNRTAVPGATVELSVTRAGSPVVGAEVAFNGDPVGTTDRRGTVVATVPYASNLTVTVTGGTVLGESASVALPAGGGGVAGGGLAPGDPAAFDLPVPPPARENATESFDVATRATLAISGDAVTAGEVTVTATVEGVPVANATVTVDGRRVGRTDERGRAAVTLPADPGNVTLRVARDPVAGNRTLALPALRANATAAWPLPVAGTPLDVRATMDGDPATGATVRLGGERVGETGVDGTLSARLPLASSVSVVVSAHGQRVRTTVADPLLNLVGALAAAAALVTAVGAVLYRREVGPRTVAAWVERALVGAYRGVVRALVALALAVDRAGTAALERLRHGAATLLAVIAGRRSVASVAASLRAWLASVRSGPLLGRTSAPAAAAGANGDGDAADETYLTVREAWARFLSRLSVRRPWTKTPAQLAAHAVEEDGLPADAVQTLVAEFRAVEYGPRSPAESVPAVRSAAETIEAAVEDRASGGTGDGRADDGTGPDERAAGEGVAD